MTQEEADKLAAAIRTVDGGCSVCVSNLCERLNAMGFGFIWTVDGDEDVVEQPEWSDDPEDASTHYWPVVTARKAA